MRVRVTFPLIFNSKPHCFSKIFIKYFGLSILIFLFGLCLFEASRLYIAYKKTPDIRTHVLSDSVLRIRLGNIPDEWIIILLKVEDPEFFNHKGVDFSTPGAGLTTIPQGMVKYLYFEKFQPGIAKIEQSLIARYILSEYFTKQEQLEVFLNTAYLGHKNGAAIYGFSDASNVYFNKDFDDLNEEEYLSLIAMLIGPNEFSIERNPVKNLERVGRIKNLLSGKYKPKGVTDTYYNER